MTSRASCIRARASTSNVAVAPWRATASTSAIPRFAPVRTIASSDRLDRGTSWLLTVPRIVGYAARRPSSKPNEVSVLAFIDEIVIPFLNGLYGAVGYLGVMVAMAIESAMIPLPSELILPYAGFLISDTSQLEPLTAGPWSFWIVVVVATIGNTLGSLVAYAIGAYGGRPFLERYGRYLLIRPHEIELADRLFERRGAAIVFIGRLLPIVRTFISFPAGVARMPLGRFIVYSTAGALLWSILLVYAGTVLGANWVEIRHALQPFDLAIAVAVVGAVVLFVWWRLGMPGRSGRSSRDA
jgi:membrane protein DedA with SNARE-associated domain